MFEIVEHPDKLAAFEELLRPYGIKETVRTGRIAMRRALGTAALATRAHARARLTHGYARSSRQKPHEDIDDEGLLRR